MFSGASAVGVSATASFGAVVCVAGSAAVSFGASVDSAAGVSSTFFAFGLRGLRLTFLELKKLLTKSTTVGLF